MNGILYFILFVCFVQVQCKDNKTEQLPCLLKHKYFHEQQRNKTNEKNSSSNNTTTSQIHLDEENKTIHTRKTRSVPDTYYNKRDKTEGDGVFDPDTQLVDYTKILRKFQTTRPPAEGEVQPSGSLIPMDEAKRLHKLKPVKPLDVNVQLPHPEVPEKNSPHGFGVRNGTYNYESRKLFERPKDFSAKNLESLMTYNEKSSTHKSVKKDLSRYLPLVG